MMVTISQLIKQRCTCSVCPIFAFWAQDISEQLSDGYVIFLTFCDKISLLRYYGWTSPQCTWKLYLFLEHQYQPVSFFRLTAAILVYPCLHLKQCLRIWTWTEDVVWRNRFPINNINACWFLLLVLYAQTVFKSSMYYHVFPLLFCYRQPPIIFQDFCTNV